MIPREFAELMERELDANAAKGDWSAWRPSKDEVVAELYHHVRKIARAIDMGGSVSVTEHGADVGNIAMKAVEMYGAGWVVKQS